MTTPSHDWSEDAFFNMPDRDSLDGGNTSAGALWHGISPRWGHSMHTMCSYHGMFPAKVAHYFIQRYSRPGDLVLDPFSGRGTVPLQARVEGRHTVSNDLNPLAYVLSRAKAHPPTWNAMDTFLQRIETAYHRADRVNQTHPKTYACCTTPAPCVRSATCANTCFAKALRIGVKRSS